MRAFGHIRNGNIFVLGLVFLTGCDLLGIGPKKDNNAQTQTTAPVQVQAPQSTPEMPNPVPGPIPSNALVRIGNWTLTQEDFTNRINLLKQQLPDFKDTDANSKNAVLGELVRQQLLVQEAEDSGIANTPEIKDAVEDFKKTLLVQEMASRLTKNVIATEDDARNYYEANLEKFKEPVTWDVSQIVVPDEATAKNILVQILQGGDFASLAQTQSKAANGPQGGKLDPFVSGKAPFDAMQTAIDGLDVGGVSGVFKGPEGSYIVKVNSKKGGDTKSFADVKKDLIYGLTMQKQQEVLLSHLKDLADKYKPERNDALIKQVVGEPTETNTTNPQ